MIYVSIIFGSIFILIIFGVLLMILSISVNQNIENINHFFKVMRIVFISLWSSYSFLKVKSTIYSLDLILLEQISIFSRNLVQLVIFSNMILAYSNLSQSSNSQSIISSSFDRTILDQSFFPSYTLPPTLKLLYYHLSSDSPHTPSLWSSSNQKHQLSSYYFLSYSPTDLKLTYIPHNSQVLG